MKQLFYFLIPMAILVASCGEEEDSRPSMTVTYYSNSSNTYSCGYLLTKQEGGSNFYYGSFDNDLPENVKYAVRQNGSAVVTYSTILKFNENMPCQSNGVSYQHVRLQDVALN